MKRIRFHQLAMTVLMSSLAFAQVDHIIIPAGTPEDQELQTITNENDGQKKLAMYTDFLQKYSSNPAAVAYGNWQVSQYYQTAGDLPKALEFGDKALAGSPRNFDILASQATIAQQLKDDAKMVDYSEKGGQAYLGIEKQAKPEGMSDDEFKTHIESDKDGVKSSYAFLEGVGYTAITDEKDPKKRMAYIERYTAAYPGSQYQEQVSQYAAYTLGPGQLNDAARLQAFAEKSIAANPNNLPVLLVLSNSYVEDSKPASVAKAVTYSQKVIELAKADATDADRAHKLSAGVAHSILGYAYMKQDKTAASIPEFKSASSLLKGQDDGQYAIALYRMGYAYAKLKKNTEAREVLTEAVRIPGPMQGPSQELLTKVNAARAAGK